MYRGGGVLLAGGLVAFAMGSAPLPAAAQEVDSDPLDQLVERLDVLKPMVDAETRARRIARGMETGVKTETFQVGPLKVVARVEQRAAVEAAFRRALPFYVQTLRGGSEGILEVGTWAAQFYSGPLAAEMGVWAEDVEPVDIPTSGGVARMATRVRQLLGGRLTSGLPEAVHEWAGNTPLTEPDFDAGYNWSGLHRDAVTIGSSAVRACLVGEASACWSVLGFPTAENPTTEWYSEDEIQHRALLVAETLMRGARAFRRGDGSIDRVGFAEAADQMNTCRDGGMEACLQLATGIGHRAPLSLNARSSLVWLALEEGGEGAYTRLIQAGERGESIQASLGAAANQHPDELVKKWSAAVNGARSQPQSELAFASFSALLWIMGLAGTSVFAARRRVV